MEQPKVKVSFKNKGRDIEESFHIDKLFEEPVEDDVQEEEINANNVPIHIDDDVINSKSEKNDGNDHSEHDHDLIHSEFFSIFENYTEFSFSNSSTLKTAALEEEPHYLFFLESKTTDIDVDDYLKHCNICMEFQYNVAFCGLCSTSICFSCLSQYLETSVMDGVIEFYCPSDDSCTKKFSENLVSAFVKPETFSILTKNKIDNDSNPNVKTCPGCHKVTKRMSVKQSQKGQEYSRVNCRCGMSWCFSCYSPWHTGLSCKSYQKDAVASGDKALRFWAKVGMKGRKNARKCPKCKIYIERITGCDHMFCKRCDTNFCYRCGNKHYDLGMIGNHYSTYSFLGCKYNLHPSKPALRIAKRSGVLFGAIILSPIALGGVTVAATIGIPSILIYRKCCK